MDVSLARAVLDLVAARRRTDVVEIVRTAVREQGVDATVRMLADVQQEVGRRWQTQQWSVADEHAATGIIDLALSVAAVDAPANIRPQGRATVACAEGEWHVLPPRMLAEQLRVRGWDVVFLGASMPAEHLRTFLAEGPPAPLVLSCSVSMFLPGARRSIAAAHASGIPVLAGGAGFGSSPGRALTLGADGWAGDVEGAVDVLARWLDRPPELSTASPDATEQDELARCRSDVVDGAVAALANRFPQVDAYSHWQRARTREDLDYILRFVEAALLTGDDSIVTEFTAWLSDILEARGVAPGLLPGGLQVLHSLLPPHLADAKRLVALAGATAGDAR